MKKQTVPPHSLAKAAQTITPAWLRLKQLAVYLGCSRATAHRITVRPDFPEPQKLSFKYVVWERAAVDRWRAAQLTRSEYNAAHPKRAATA